MTKGLHLSTKQHAGYYYFPNQPQQEREVTPENDPHQQDGTGNQEEQDLDNDDNPEGDVEGEHVFWNGTLPAAKGKVAKLFAQIPLAQQKEDTASLLTFLQSESPQLSKLNASPSLISALVNIPDSYLLKVVYCLGFGTGAITTTSPIDGKILAL